MIEPGWRLAQLPPPKHAPTLFSCFHGGGGSCMGYKLAGFDVVGGVELDSKMMALYRANLSPRESFLSDIRNAPLPMASIDVLDGSPPCTSFSSAGLREKSWGQTKAFREGSTRQRLDDLFFAFIDYAERLQPRVIVAENVIGLLTGNARFYTRRILEAFSRIGYTAQVLCLSAAHYGVAQLRPRVFFIASRGKRRVDQPPASTPRCVADVLPCDSIGKRLNDFYTHQWKLVGLGRRMDGHGFSRYKLNPNTFAPTLTAQSILAHWEQPHQISAAAYLRLQSFPDDYAMLGRNPVYVCGMSVAPFVAYALGRQIIQDLL